MDKTIIISGKLDKKDILAFLFSHNYSRLGGKLTALAGIIALVLAPVFIYKGNLATGLILCIVALMYTVATPLDFYFKASRQMRVNPVFKNKITYILSEEDFEVKLYTGASKVSWEKVIKVTELKNQFLIYLKEKHAMIVPKKNFACVDDVELLKEFIQEKKLGINLKKRMEETENDESNL